MKNATFCIKKTAALYNISRITFYTNFLTTGNYNPFKWTNLNESVSMDQVEQTNLNGQM